MTARKPSRKRAGFAFLMEAARFVNFMMKEKTRRKKKILRKEH